MYKAVLRSDPRNIWAANGIGTFRGRDTATCSTHVKTILSLNLLGHHVLRYVHVIMSSSHKFVVVMVVV